MRTYLSTLHKRSPTHKKHFALLVSGGFTLSIFTIWAAVNFGGGAAATASANKSVADANPFGSLMRGLDASFESLKESLGGMKKEVESVDIGSGYQEMKNNTLDIYGR